MWSGLLPFPQAEEAERGREGGPEGQAGEFEVHPGNLRKLPKAFHFQQGSYRVFYEVSREEIAVGGVRQNSRWGTAQGGVALVKQAQVWPGTANLAPCFGNEQGNADQRGTEWICGERGEGRGE